MGLISGRRVLHCIRAIGGRVVGNRNGIADIGHLPLAEGQGERRHSSQLKQKIHFDLYAVWIS